MMTWTIDSFTPSDGKKIKFVQTDHQAWLKGEDGEKHIHILLNISSRGVSDNEAHELLKAMVAGLKYFGLG